MSDTRIDATALALMEEIDKLRADNERLRGLLRECECYHLQKRIDAALRGGEGHK